MYVMEMNDLWHHTNKYDKEVARRRPGLHLLLDALLEASPALLAAKALEAAVHAVLHHRDELLVTEQAVAVVVKDLQCLQSLTRKCS